ncbi:MAG: DNA polymerase III subunit gamma/tau [Planctomycetes bacterium]|nr:DNA polymerase III subunit gamma/tau [Planctomycetota bacterium]
MAARKQSAGGGRANDAAGAATGYQVVARRFRPQTFGEMVGQDEILQSLKKAIEQQRIPHAFLFSGSRGVGKTTSARILARCLNCGQGPTPDPCGECDHCRSILDGSNPDVIEIDAASNNSVDDVRQLREHAAFATMRSRYRVFILDEVHMLSKGAFNALLKTLEEPPPGVVFVLATTELHKVPETIRSRCQVLMFKRVGEPDLVRRLRTIADREGIAIPDEVLAEIAAAVRGGVRDAETALERVLPIARELGAEFDLAAYRALVARVGTDAVVEVVATLLDGDAKGGLHFARSLQEQGIDEREALGELVEVLRWLMLLQVDGPESVLVPAGGAVRQRLHELSGKANVQKLDAMITAGLLGRERLRRLEDRGVVFEVALVRMAQAGTLPTVAELLDEVRAGGGVAVASGGGPAAVAAQAHSEPAHPADLRARVLDLARDKSLLHATLGLCEFTGPDAGGKVVVSTTTARKMHQDRLQSPDVRQQLQQWLRQALGRDVQVEIRLGAAPAVDAGPAAAGHGGDAKPAAAKKSRAAPGPAAQRVMGRFHGRVVEVNPEDRVKREPPADDDGSGTPPDEPEDS